MKRLIRFDWAMKRLLRQKANFVILEGFLSELLGEDVRIRNVLESEGNKDHEADKFNRVDLLAERLHPQELMLIEVQNTMEYDYFQRILYGASKLVTEYISESQPYADIRKVYSVNIVYFDLGHGDDYVYHGTTSFIGIHRGDVLHLNAQQRTLYQKETLAALYPEYYLIKVNQFDDVAKNTLDEWVYFLKHEEIGEHTQAKGLREAKQRLDVMKLPEKQQQQYKRYVEDLHYQASMAHTYAAMQAEGLAKVRAEGLAEGQKSQAIAIARNLLAEGLSVELIMKCTSLTADEIAALS